MSLIILALIFIQQFTTGFSQTKTSKEKFDDFINQFYLYFDNENKMSELSKGLITNLGIVKADAKSMSALKAKLVDLSPQPSEYEFRTALIYLQNYFYCQEVIPKIKTLITTVLPTEPHLIHTKETDIDSFLNELHLKDRIYKSQKEMEIAIKRSCETLAENQIRDVYQIYERYVGYMRIKKVVNSLNAKRSEPNVITKHKDLFEELIDVFEIPKTEKRESISSFQRSAASKDPNYVGHIEIYRNIYQIYYEYRQKVKIADIRNAFLTLIKSNKPDTDTDVVTAFQSYMSMIGNPIEVKNEDQLYTTLIKTDVFITKPMVTLIYPSYTNLYVKKRRVALKDELKKIANTDCKIQTNIDKMEIFISLNGNPQHASTAIELFNIFTKIDNTFTQTDANDIFTCYNIYYELMGTREHKIKLIKKLKIPNIIPVDYENEMKDFLKDYQLSTSVKYSDVASMVTEAQKIDPGYVSDTDTINIFNKHSEYIDILNLRKARNEILEKLKTTKNPWELNSLIVDLKNAYSIGADRIDKNSFYDKLNNKDNVPDCEIDILYAEYYDNHEYNEKLQAITNIHTRITSFTPNTRVEDYRDEMILFAKKLHLHFDETPLQDAFKEHIENQVGNSLTTKVQGIYDTYKKYLDYEKQVQAFNDLYDKINKHNNLFSMMQTEFDNFITLLKIQRIPDKTNDAIKNNIKRSIRSPDRTKLNTIVSKIHKYELYKSSQSYREALYNYIMENHNPTSVGIKNSLNNLILKFNLNSQDIRTVDRFHELLSEINDEIKLEESKIFYKYYRKFKIMWNKQSIRDSLFNYLQQGNRFPTNKLSIYYMMFIDAYGIKNTKFKNVDELKSFLEQQDDTVNDEHVEMIFEPLSIYLSYLERKSKEENLYYFIMSRSDHFGRDLSAYIKPYYDSYHLSYDIIFDKSVFESHIEVLDGSIEQIKVNTIYPEIVEYSANIDKLNIVLATYEFIKQNPKYSMSQISPYFEIFLHFFNVDENLLKLKEFSDQVNDAKEIKRDIILVLYRHFLKFIEYKKFVIVKKLLISQIQHNAEIKFEEIREYMTPYIQKLKLSYEELLDYGDFSRKNLQLDESVSKAEIDLLHKNLIIYITSSKYTDRSLFEKVKETATTTEKVSEFYEKPESGAPSFWFNLMNGIGINPKQIDNFQEITDLSYYKQIFNDFYKSLTKIDYYHFPNKEESPEMVKRFA